MVEKVTIEGLGFTAMVISVRKDGGENPFGYHKKDKR